MVCWTLQSKDERESDNHADTPIRKSSINALELPVMSFNQSYIRVPSTMFSHNASAILQKVAPRLMKQCKFFCKMMGKFKETFCQISERGVFWKKCPVMQDIIKERNEWGSNFSGERDGKHPFSPWILWAWSTNWTEGTF